MGQALCVLAYVAHRRGRDDTALERLQDAAALYRNLDDRWQLADIMIDLAAQEAFMGRAADALQAVAESSQLEAQIGRLSGRPFRLAAAAVVHMAGGQRALSISALGAYDAHAPPAGYMPRNRIGGYVGRLVDSVNMTRARLDPAEVAAAAAAARRKSLDDLIDELIIQPAKAAGASCSTIESGEDS